MSAYRYELVDREFGVLQRWEAEHADDDRAIAGLDGVPLLPGDDESARVFRPGEEGSLAVRTLDFGVEVLL